jgi:PKD repeat protein
LTYGSVVRHIYPGGDSYTAVVTATNKVSMLTTTSTVDVVTSEEEITELVAVNDGPTVLGATTTLTATVTAGTNTSHTWDLGDGTPATGDVVHHVYPEAGQYTAVVTATNEVNLLTTISTVDMVTSEEDILVYLPLVMRSTTGLSR